MYSRVRISSQNVGKIDFFKKGKLNGDIWETGLNIRNLTMFIFCTSQFWYIFAVVVQSLSHMWLFATPWTAAHQTSLSLAISLSLLKLKSIELVMPSNHLNFCHPLFLLPSIFPNIRMFSNELALCIRWSKY